jgi:hypothetical protein
VREGHFAEARGEPQVRLTATARDLVTPRLGGQSQAEVIVEGGARAKERFCTLFGLPRQCAGGRARIRG